MNLTIILPDEDVMALKARARARGVSAEQYALDVLEQNLAMPQEAFAGPERYKNLSDLLLSSPFFESDLDLSRSQDGPRPVDMG